MEVIRRASVATITQRHVVAFQITSLARSICSRLTCQFGPTRLPLMPTAQFGPMSRPLKMFAYRATRLIHGWIRGRAETKWFRWAKWLASLIGQNRRLTFAA
ncbi:hypothetical protein [Klebsiella phage vB_KshKPC-M]|nr:hypothetical protein [Klebsiella phage vB_KshKPC-M]